MSEQTMGYFVIAPFTVVVVVDILYAYYGWVRLPPRQSRFVWGWLAAVALLAVMGIAAVKSRLGEPNPAYIMTLAALAGLLLLSGPLLTPWQERRPIMIVMNILSSLTGFVTILEGWLIYGMSHIWGITNYLGVVRGLAFSVPFVILTPICMVASTRLARQGRRSAIYVAYIPVALAAFVHVAFLFVPTSAPGWRWHPATGRWS